MSAFKRVDHLLRHVDKRAVQSTLSRTTKGRFCGGRQENDEPEAIFIKATGKAIEKALSLALFMQDMPKFDIRIRTTSVDAIDDIVNISIETDHDGDVDDLPESRIRRTNMVEVSITLR